MISTQSQGIQNQESKNRRPRQGTQDQEAQKQEYNTMNPQSGYSDNLLIPRSQNTTFRSNASTTGDPASSYELALPLLEILIAPPEGIEVRDFI